MVAKVSSIQVSWQDDYILLVSFQSVKVAAGSSSCSALEKESDTSCWSAAWICMLFSLPL